MRARAYTREAPPAAVVVEFAATPDKATCSVRKSLLQEFDMPERIKQFSPGGGRGRPGRDWDKLADGSVWRLRRGTDFDSSIQSLRNGAAAAADRLGLNVRVHKVDEDVVEMQFLPRS